MVLPEDREPDDYDWPSNGQPALIHERGDYNDDRLISMAKALILAGSPSVVAIREALLDHDDPRVFFDREVNDVAA
jgi:hypothetical protein